MLITGSILHQSYTLTFSISRTPYWAPDDARGFARERNDDSPWQIQIKDQSHNVVERETKAISPWPVFDAMVAEVVDDLRQRAPQRAPLRMTKQVEIAETPRRSLIIGPRKRSTEAA